MKNIKNLEETEKKKYNYLVKQHNFGKDPERKVNILKMINDYENCSKIYLQILTETKTALEIGTGPATMMNWMQKEHNIDIYGIDISDEMVNYAVSIFPNFYEKIKVGNAKNLPFEDDYFDLVQHLDGMEHIPEEWEYECLKEAIRVSKKYIIYNNATGNATADEWAAQGGYTNAHINVKTAERWLEFYKKNTDLGYDIVDYYNTGGEIIIILKKNK